MAFRVALAGAGVRGRDWMREITADPRFELVAVVDPDLSGLDGVPPAAARDRCFESLDDALERIACDAVVIATPADHHEASCRSAIARGLAVLVEKPFTMRLQAAMELVDAAAERNVPVIVAQNYRHMRAWRTAARLVADGALGEIGSVHCQYHRVPHAIVPSLARLQNSVLWGMGVHHLDAILHVLGRRVTGVVADIFTAHHPAALHGASMNALLEFEGGARVTYSASYESSGHEFFERGQEFYARIVGRTATLHILHRWLLLCRAGKLPRLVARGPRPMSEERALLGELAEAMSGGGEPHCSGRDNLRTMAVVEACVRSSEGRRWVDPQQLLAGRDA